MAKKPQPVAPTRYKRPFLIDGDGVCLWCGRKRGEGCHCGELTNLQCSQHSEVMNVIALPVYGNLGDGVRSIVAWLDAAECPVCGCYQLRAIKTGQGGPRNMNRKGSQHA